MAVREYRLSRNQPREAAAEIQGEIDNVRQAWAWAAHQGRLPTLAATLAALYRFYGFTGVVVEGEQSLHLAAECIRSRAAPQTVEAQHLLSTVLALRAHLLVLYASHPQVIPLAQEAIALGEASGAIVGQAMGYYTWGYALARQSRCSEARACAEQALQLAQQHQRTLDDSSAPFELLYEVEWVAYYLLSNLHYVENDYPGAIAYVTKGLHRCQTLGKLQGESLCLLQLAELLKKVNDSAAARLYGERALHSARALGYRWVEAASQLQLSTVARLLGEYTLADAYGQGAITLFRTTGAHALVAAAAALLGQLHSYLGNADHADEWFDEFGRQIEGLAIPDDEVEMEGLLPAALHCHHYGNHLQALAYADKAWQIAHRNRWPRGQAHALLVRGHALSALQWSDEASEAYGQALVLCHSLGNPHFAVEVRAGLAGVALAQGDLSLAQSHVEAILTVLADHPLAGLDEPFFAYLTCYRVLAVHHDPRTAHLLQKGYDLLQVYASRIGDDSQRRSFLDNIAVHCDLQQAYATWSLSTGYSDKRFRVR